ncbi:hypothetical protein DAMA08_030300 [Martiniozyma asiatica (nom. inval.)]|nr:hypothetical protein DAMA08_030300 [Martiniozyma asiatica]
MRKRKAPQPLTTAKKLKLKSQEVDELKRKLREQDETIKHLRGFTKDEENIISEKIKPKDQLAKYGTEIDELKILVSSTKDSIKNEFVTLSEARAESSEVHLDYQSIDVINSGLLTETNCEELIKIFVDNIYPRYPFIDLPKDMSVNNLRENDPLLFLVIIEIALTASKDSTLSLVVNPKLDSIVSRALAIEILSIGNKNIPLVKSLLLYCFWYPPPEFFHHRRYHLFTSLCSSMAHDLGLSGRPYFYLNSENGALQKTVITDAKDLELKSLILTVYITMGSISFFLRRIIAFPWTDYMSQCCLVLENKNQRKYHLVTLYASMNHLLEKIHNNVHVSAEHLTILEISSSKSKVLVLEYQTQISKIKEKINLLEDVKSSDFHSLMSYLYSVQAYLYEPSIQSIARGKIKLTAEHQNIIYYRIGQLCEACILSVQHFLKLQHSDITANPLFHTSRIIYTSGMLLKIRHLSLTIPETIKPSIFTNDSIKVFTELINKIEDTIKKFPNNNFLKKLRIVLDLFAQTCLNQWCASYTELSKSIQKKDFSFVDPRSEELKIFKVEDRPNFPFQMISESGNSTTKMFSTGRLGIRHNTSTLRGATNFNNLPSMSSTVVDNLQGSIPLDNSSTLRTLHTTNLPPLPITIPPVTYDQIRNVDNNVSNYEKNNSGILDSDIGMQMLTFNDELWTDLFFTNSAQNNFDFDIDSFY